MTKMVKIMHEQLGLGNGSPLKVKWCDYDYFKYPWHFHPEYEIVYIIRSTGLRFSGSAIEEFSDGDLVLFGSFLPHMYRNDGIYYEGRPDLRVHAITVQFSNDFFDHAINHYPEFKKIRTLLENARQGIYFDKHKPRNDNIRKRLHRLVNLTGLERVLECVKILSMMSSTPYKRTLGDKTPDRERLVLGDGRLNKILGKLNCDYLTSVNLNEMASFAGMNPSAFCRYFREKTGKSMVRYINELRIRYACKLLLTGELNISQICYECGYNNLSNFNRHFKAITGFTPTDYLSKFKLDERQMIFTGD